MTDRRDRGVYGLRVLVALAVCVTLVVTVRVQGQASEAKGSAQFDVASVRPSRPGAEKTPKSNVPLGPGDLYSPTGGVLSAKNFTLSTYLAFAYRLTDGQLAAVRERLPDWATTELFNIEARASGETTKDQLRMMMRALLGERFGLVAHNESRPSPVLDWCWRRPG